MIISVRTWGGLNVRDPSDQLMSRSHVATPQGFVQQFPMETPSAKNMEHTEQGIRQRRGWSLDSASAAALLDGDTLLGGISWHNPSNNNEIQFLVSTRTCYSDQSGAWVQLTDTAAAAYTHAATVGAGGYSLTPIEGHLMIALDGANDLQTYRSGSALDSSVTTNASWQHSYSATDKVVTGTWGQGKHIAAAIHGRYAFTDGNTLFEYTPMAQTPDSGIWDLLGSTSGSFFADGPIRMLATHNPGGGDAKDSILYVGTANGMTYTSGFQDYDRNEEAVDPEAPMNHRAFFRARNWLIYLTRDKNIKAIRGGQVIDIGNRLRNTAKTGPLDLISISQSETYSFGFYDPESEFGGISVSTSTARVNDSIIIVDLKLLEGGIPNERNVRLQHWQILNPNDNDWFVHIYRRESDLIGVMATGNLYKIADVNNDLAGNLAIDARHSWPDFAASDAELPAQKQWLRLDQNAASTGDWSSTLKTYLDRDLASVDSFDWKQVNPGAFIVGTAKIGDPLGSSGMVRRFDRVLKRSETIRFENSNKNIDETFTLHTAALTYEPLEIVR